MLRQFWQFSCFLQHLMACKDVRRNWVHTLALRWYYTSFLSTAMNAPNSQVLPFSNLMLWSFLMSFVWIDPKYTPSCCSKCMWFNPPLKIVPSKLSIYSCLSDKNLQCPAVLWNYSNETDINCDLLLKMYVFSRNKWAWGWIQRSPDRVRS